MVFEEINILGHLVDFFFDLLELGFKILEICIEMHDLLAPFLLFNFECALALIKHNINYPSTLLYTNCQLPSMVM